MRAEERLESPNLTDESADGREPRADESGAGSARPAMSDTDQPWIDAGQGARVRERWHEIQATFVDDPREAVRQADGLVDEMVNAVTAAVGERHQALRGGWQAAGDADTERLRRALHGYRSVLERLLV